MKSNIKSKSDEMTFLPNWQQQHFASNHVLISLREFHQILVLNSPNWGQILADAIRSEKCSRAAKSSTECVRVEEKKWPRQNAIVKEEMSFDLNGEMQNKFDKRKIGTKNGNISKKNSSKPRKMMGKSKYTRFFQFCPESRTIRCRNCAYFYQSRSPSSPTNSLRCHMKNHHPSQFEMLQMTECRHKEKEPIFLG